MERELSAARGGGSANSPSTSAPSGAGRALVEVVRRLHIALDVHDHTDRDLVLTHLLSDLAGEVSTAAAESLGSEAGKAFYEAIAEELLAAEKAGGRDLAALEDLLSAFERLWASPKAALSFALVTHRYLLLSKRKIEKRDKYSRVLVTGMKNLFWSDLHMNSSKFLSLYRFLSYEAVLSDAGIGKLSASAQLESCKVSARPAAISRRPALPFALRA